MLNIGDEKLNKKKVYPETSIILDNDVTVVDKVVDQIGDYIKQIFDQDDVHGLILGIYEIILNAIEHGNLEINYAEKSRLIEQEHYYDELVKRAKKPNYEDRKVHISYTHNQDAFTITVEDNGNGFDWRNLVHPKDRLLALHGRGITLARFYFDEVTFNDKGNRVTLIKKIKHA